MLKASWDAKQNLQLSFSSEPKDIIDNKNWLIPPPNELNKNKTGEQKTFETKGFWFLEIFIHVWFV